MVSAAVLATFLGPIFTPQALAAKTVPGDSGVEKELRFKEGDETGNEVKALKTELLVIKSEKKALEQLLRLQKKYENTRMEAEILFRLGELYMRRARSERFFEVHRGSDQVMMFAPQLVKEASEAGEIRKAIVNYQKIQERFPRFHSMDVVLFNSAYAYQQIGDDKSAETMFQKLLKDHASSNLVPDSYLAIGEINFKARKYDVALQNFKEIRRFPRARVYPYGLYKAAWSSYNLQDANAAMAQLEEVITFGREVVDKGWDSKLDLRKEALGDLTLFYLDIKPAKEAVDYFRAQAKDLDVSVYLMRLVELYKRHSRYSDVEIVLRDVLGKMPDSPAVAQAHEEMIWNFEHTQQHTSAVAQLVAFDTYCSGKVVTSKGGAQTLRPECRDKIAETSKKLANKWHGIWKKAYGFTAGSGGTEIAGSADQAYRVYLKSAAQTDVDRPAVHYSYAELLFALKKYRDASENYAAIEQYQQGGLKVELKIAHDSAYAAILSLEKAVDNKFTDQDEARFLALSDAYLKRHPKGQYVLDLSFKRAFIAYEKERYDEAAPQFKRIGWAPAYLGDGVTVPEKVAKAQDLYLDILNIKKDYKAIREAAQQLLKSSDSARTTHVEKIYREAYFAEIQLKEESGDLNGAIDAYKKFALENAASDLAAKAWWNASQLQFRIGDATGGANTCYQMHKLFPNSSNGKECLTKAANTFEAMGRLDLAAKVLLNLAEVEVEHQDKWREVAADFFALSGAKDRAITMYLKLAEDKKNSGQSQLLEKAAQLARESGDLKILAQVESIFTEKGIEPQASRLVVEQAEALLENGDLTKAFNLSKRIISKDSLPKDLQARARFVQARVLEDEYRKASVKARMERVGVVLAIKTEKLEKAQKAFQSAIHYGDPSVTVKSLERLGNCYVDYASTVRAMKITSQLSAADQAGFKAEIEQLAIPMEEKGIESMNQALEAARKAQLRDGQIAELQAQVNRMNLKPNAPAMRIAGPPVLLPEFRLGQEMVQ